MTKAEATRKVREMAAKAAAEGKKMTDKQRKAMIWALTVK